MRTKLLQGRDDVTVQLVYPSARRVPSGSRCSRRLPSGGRERRLAPGRMQAWTRSLRGHDGAAAPSVGSPGVRRRGSRRRATGARPAPRRGRRARQGGRAVPRPFPRSRFGVGRRRTRRFVVRRRAWLPLARRAHRSGRRGARPRRSAECRSRGAVGQAERGVRLRSQGRRGGAGPGPGGARPAVGKVRVPAVRPGACGAGARSHPRRARRRQGRHDDSPY